MGGWLGGWVADGASVEQVRLLGAFAVNNSRARRRRQMVVILVHSSAVAIGWCFSTASSYSSCYWIRFWFLDESLAEAHQTAIAIEHGPVGSGSGRTAAIAARVAATAAAAAALGEGVPGDAQLEEAVHRRAALHGRVEAQCLGA